MKSSALWIRDGGLSPEEYLLVLAARIHLDDATESEMAAILNSNIDWNRILTDADQFGIQPLLFKHLSEKFSDQVPENVLAELDKTYRRESMKALRREAQIREILEITERHQIPTVLLKGAFLGTWLYGDAGLRPMGDIDILCREQDAPVLRNLLMEAGFDEMNQVAQTELAQNLHIHLLPLVKNDHRVELHTSLFRGVSVDIKTICSPNSDGSFSYTLLPEYLILFLCCHLHYHFNSISGCVLYWFSDIHESIRYYADKELISWTEFCRIAEMYRMSSSIGSVLNLMKTVWHTPVPETVLQKLDGEKYTPAFLKDRLFNSNPDYSSYYLDIFKRIKYTKGFVNQMVLFIRLIFPQQEYLISRYRLSSSDPVWLYYFIHPVMIIRRIVSRFVYSKELPEKAE